MQKSIDFDSYRRELQQLDLFDEKLNAIKSKQFVDSQLFAAERKHIQERGITRMLKSSHYGKKKA